MTGFICLHWSGFICLHWPRFQKSGENLQVCFLFRCVPKHVLFFRFGVYIIFLGDLPPRTSKKWAFGKTTENLTEETKLQIMRYNEFFRIHYSSQFYFYFYFLFLIGIKCCPIQIIMWNLKPKSLTVQRYHCSRLFIALRGIFLGPSPKSSGQELSHYCLLLLTHVIHDLLNANRVELN